MRSLSSLGLALSVVFTCLLFALIAEIYYLLWWKNRIIRANQIENVYTFCCNKKLNSTNAPHQSPIDESNSKDYLVKSLDDCYDYEDGVLETGLISGPPRFLFTIKEETKEDLLDSEMDINGKISSSLSDLLVKTVETPYITPLSSPPFLTPMGSSHSSNSGCSYNPFYEASSDVEFSRMVKASPPPKFKFLRDAEEKLRRRTMLVEEGNEGRCNYGEEEGQDGNFITVIVANCNNK